MHKVKLQDIEYAEIRECIASSFGDGENKQLNVIVRVCTGCIYYQVIDGRLKKEYRYNYIAEAIGKYNSI